MAPAPDPPLVLHVIPTAVARGAQREARALVDRLDEPGRRHHRLLCLFAGSSEIPVDLSLEHAGGRGPVAQGFDPLLVVRLRRLLRRLDPAVTVAHGGDPLKYLVPAAAGRRAPVAYYATGTFGAAARPLQVLLWRRLVARAAVVAAEGAEVLAECRDLLSVPPERLVLAPNGRDPAVFRPGDAPAAADGAGAAPTVVFVGAFTAGKGPERFVAMAGELRRAGMAVRAVACGDGPMHGELAGPAAEARVELLGTVDDVAGVLRGADILVFPSRPTGEGMPGVLIEAGMSGLPVVATDVPGVRSVIEDGVTGFVVPVDDHDALVRATARLVEDEGLRRTMGSAARQRCVERFSLDGVVETWRGFLQPLVDAAVSDRRAGSGRARRTGPGA